jgi:hypothetical protein
MLSNMESDPKTDLRDADRLAAKARAAANAWPLSASVVLLVAEMILVAAVAFSGVSTPMAVVWIAFLAVFHLVVRSRRRAQPRRTWADPESRRLAKWSLAATIAVNAVWLPLFFLARPVALALLFAALVASLVSNIVMTRHAHA